jgi:hypothetical protein
VACLSLSCVNDDMPKYKEWQLLLTGKTSFLHLGKNEEKHTELHVHQVSVFKSRFRKLIFLHVKYSSEHSVSPQAVSCKKAAI